MFSFKILRKEDSPPSCDVEIFPGKYCNKPDHKDFLYVDEDVFFYVERMIYRYFEEYEHWGSNDIPKEIGLKIINDWRISGNKLDKLSAREAYLELGYNLSDINDFAMNSMVEEKRLIAKLMLDLASECEKIYQENDWMCILGP